ncbi:hypothetical protein EVAR_98570_1 [Eumeta japonica]|uniref:Uncharacterized protein n=1 Tax=Eumeta variegata TaxID=151549 RepID=A0A4C1YUK3_EUMVA|nr:hypothetical protein EVAR_98570_1 [Eumeta japonica]
MENNPDRFLVIPRSRKQVARPHASRVRCDPPISARRSTSSRHLAPINAHSVAQQNPYLLQARRKELRSKIRIFEERATVLEEVYFLVLTIEHSFLSANRTSTARYNLSSCTLNQLNLFGDLSGVTQKRDSSISPFARSYLAVDGPLKQSAPRASRSQPNCDQSAALRTLIDNSSTPSSNEAISKTPEAEPHCRMLGHMLFRHRHVPFCARALHWPTCHILDTREHLIHGPVDHELDFLANPLYLPA